MRIRNIALAGVTLLFLNACGNGSLSRREMTPGERVFRAKCRSCHVLPRPEAKTDEQWPAFVAEHGQRVNLVPEDRDKIVRYLQSAH